MRKEQTCCRQINKYEKKKYKKDANEAYLKLEMLVIELVQCWLIDDHSFNVTVVVLLEFFPNGLLYPLDPI